MFKLNIMSYKLTALSGWKMYDAGELSMITTLCNARPNLFKSFT